MNKFERAFDRLCTKYQLNPSGWLPHIKPDGLYEMGTSYPDPESMITESGELGKGVEVPIECFSIYNAFWTICYTRRKNRLGEAFDWKLDKSKWESLWSFLSDVDLGIYDTTNWIPVGETEDGIDFRFLER